MWGETLFGIDEDQYESDYIQQLTTQMNSEAPESEKLQQFKGLFQKWTDQFEKKKKLFPRFKDDVARRMIDLEMAKVEQDIGLFDVFSECNIQSEDFYKIANVFTNLWTKLAEMEKKLKEDIFDKLLVFGEQPYSENVEADLQGGDYELMTGRLLPFLREIFDVFEVVTLVCMNCILQLQALYDKKKGAYFKLFKELDFFFPLRILGKGLFLLLSIDSIVNESTFYEKSYLSSHWPKYRDAINMMLSDPAKYGVDPEKTKLLRRVVVKVDKGVMSGDCLGVFLTHIAREGNFKVFEEMSDFKAIRENKYLVELIKGYFKHMQARMEAGLGQVGSSNLSISEQLNEYLCVFAFYTKFFGLEHKDAWRSIWSLQKREPMLYVHRFVMIRICDFLMKYCPPKKLYSSLDPKDINQYTVGLLKQSQESLMSEVALCFKHLSHWSLKMNAMACTMYVFMSASDEDRIKIFETRMAQIIGGIICAKKIRQLIRNNFLIRVKLGYSVSPKLTQQFMLLLEMSKKMMNVIEQKDIQLMQDMMVKFLSIRICKLLKEFSVKVSNVKMSDKTFLFEPFRCLFSLMKHFPTEQRMVMADYCKTFLGIKNIIKEPELVQIRKIYEDLNSLANYKQIFRNILDCSFVYWYKDLIPDMFETKAKTDGEYFRINLLLEAIGDTKPLLQQCVHLQDNTMLFDKFRDYILDTFSKKIVKAVSVHIEEDLLIQTHHFYMISELVKPDPQKKFQGDIKGFLNQGKINVLDKLVDVKFLIETSMAESLYNRISDNQRNFDTYEVMRTVAKLKYDLELGHSYIPSKTVEQGKTDVLAILRSLVFFIQNFKYNMFNQTFIETLKESTRLKAVSITLISDSIKTHGLGIIESSINHIVDFIHK